MASNNHGAAWTEAELEIVKLNYQYLSHADLALIFGRTPAAIRNLCHKKGWRKKAAEWTEMELALLRAYYAEEIVNLDELAQRLDRPKTSVCRKARALGLTNSSRPHSQEHIQKCAKSTRRWYQTHEHPKGMKGHRHSRETRAKISRASRARAADPNSAVNSERARQKESDAAMRRWQRGDFEARTKYSSGKMGKRADLGGLFVRSAWEANYARYLNWLIEQGLILKWEYEPDVFVFHAINRGTRSYTPDFKVWTDETTYEYHEVKGWMDPKSRTKLKRMAKYYPDEKVIMIGPDEYKTLQRQVGPLVDFWE